MKSSTVRSHLSSLSNVEPSRPADALDRQFQLLTVDYERTLGIADGLVSSKSTTRSIAATAYLALLGLGVDHRSWAICAASALIALAFAWQDVRTSWLYRQLVRRANKIERLFQRRLQSLDRPYDRYPADRLSSDLESYEFGVLSSIDRFSLVRAREAITVLGVSMYLVPIVVGLAAALLV
jgi:hypothetical protein